MTTVNPVVPSIRVPVFESRGHGRIESLKNFIPNLINQTTPNIWYSIKETLFTQSELLTSLKEISKGNHDLNTCHDQIIEAFGSDQFPQLRRYLSSIFKNATDDELNVILKNLFKAHAVHNPQILLQKLKGLLTLQKVELAIKSEFNRFESAKKVALEKAGPSKSELESQITESRNSIIRMASYYILGSLEFVIDTFMFVFQLKQIEHGDEDGLERAMIANLRYEAFRDNLAVISGWTLALALYTGSIMLTVSITASIAISVLTIGFIYMKYLKPCPSHIHPMTEKISAWIKGELPKVYCREAYLEEIIRIWQANENSSFRLFPMLIGPTGVGKSDIINALAEKIGIGDVPNFLKGKKLFTVNAADLISGDAIGSMEHLEIILRELRGREHEAIIFIDETHCGFDNEMHTALGQKLKTLMDSGGFPYLIFATTTKEYEKYIEEDEAFVRRLELIEVKPTTPEQTHLILTEMVITEAPDLLVEPEAIELAAKAQETDEIFQNLPQPWFSKSLLAKLFAKKRTAKNKEILDLLQQKRDRKNFIKAQKNLRQPEELPYTSDLGEQYDKELSELNISIQTLEKELEKSKEDLKNYNILLKEYKKLKMEVKKLSITIKQKEKTLNDDLLLDFMLKLHYLERQMWNVIADCRKHVEGASPQITKEDVQKVIEERAVKLKEKKERKEKKENEKEKIG